MLGSCQYRQIGNCWCASRLQRALMSQVKFRFPPDRQCKAFSESIAVYRCGGSSSVMGAERDQIEAEAEELFLRIGLTEQTAKCAAFASPPPPLLPRPKPTRVPHACGQLTHTARLGRAYGSRADMKAAGCIRGDAWQSIAEVVPYACGLSCARLSCNPRRNSVKNPKFRQALTDVIRAAGATDGTPKARGALLYQVAGKVCMPAFPLHFSWEYASPRLAPNAVSSG